jgi:bifunctional non-homologous end joining protein LigD
MHPDAHAWRPQAFGRRRPKDVADPLVEPAWDGIRILAHVQAGRARLLDAEGVDLAPAHPEIVAELEAAALAETLVVDGYLTDQARRSGEGVILDVDDGPRMGEHMTQFFLGQRAAEYVGGRGRVPGRATARSVAQAEATAAAGPQAIAFVAVDLLVLDDHPLLDVPLLERKRLLESALAEGERVRRTPYVREPAGSFIISWRSAGFGGLAYKAANSRYRPGARNDGWSLVAMPRR